MSVLIPDLTLGWCLECRPWAWNHWFYPVFGVVNWGLRHPLTIVANDIMRSAKFGPRRRDRRLRPWRWTTVRCHLRSTRFFFLGVNFVNQCKPKYRVFLHHPFIYFSGGETQWYHPRIPQAFLCWKKWRSNSWPPGEGTEDSAKWRGPCCAEYASRTEGRRIKGAEGWNQSWSQNWTEGSGR